MVAVLSFWLGRSSVDSPKADAQSFAPERAGPGMIIPSQTLITASADGKTIYLWRLTRGTSAEQDASFLNEFKPHCIGQYEVPAQLPR
jgi:hypothetical protein